MYKIGVFDSGIGGLSVAKAIEKALPGEEVIFRYDAKGFPYANKTTEEILASCKPVFDSLIQDGCEVIVVACNTVTTNLIEKLRTEIDVPLIGMEPMVKPAAELSKSKVIAVCATPRTLQSARYAWLKDTYANGVKVIEPDCSDWSAMIENDKVNYEKIAGIIDSACSDGADVIVLGCTHYHWIESQIKELAGSRAAVIQPEAPVIVELKRVLALT